MDAKKLLVGTVSGGIVMWALGYLTWGVIFADFFAANAGSATGVARDPQLVWAVVLGTLSLAALVTISIGSAGAFTLLGGFKVGATVGFLVWFGVDFIHYGVMNIDNLTATIVDPLLEIVRTGLGGAVIGLVVEKVVGSSQGE